MSYNPYVNLQFMPLNLHCYYTIKFVFFSLPKLTLFSWANSTLIQNVSLWLFGETGVYRMKLWVFTQGKIDLACVWRCWKEEVSERVIENKIQ